MMMTVPFMAQAINGDSVIRINMGPTSVQDALTHPQVPTSLKEDQIVPHITMDFRTKSKYFPTKGNQMRPSTIAAIRPVLVPSPRDIRHHTLIHHPTPIMTNTWLSPSMPKIIKTATITYRKGPFSSKLSTT